MSRITTKGLSYKYFDVIGMAFVAALLISNTVATKIFEVGGMSFPGGILVFPLAYVFGDILTEVYGYAASRRVIWTGFAMNVLMVLVYAGVGALPHPGFWPHQEAYEAILGQVPRIVLASVAAYSIGEFTNSYILARMKVATRGRHLWLRTIGSTVVGEGVDTVVFGMAAFGGVYPPSIVVGLIASNYGAKVLYEVLATPLTYRVVAFLKRTEGVDHYDVNTDFNPFRFSIDNRRTTAVNALEETGTS